MENTKETIKIGVHVDVEGIHCFPEAEEIFGKEVAYLQFPHRHIFKIDCETIVTHTDRDKEFICFKHNIIEYLKNMYYDEELQVLNFGRMSCEQIAQNLVDAYGLCRCKVSEDGENYAIIEVK